jgi:hypothetical protein
MISTHDLSEMPEPRSLMRLTKAIAMLDAIIQPEWEYRYYSYDSRWSPTENVASMRNGQGDQWFCVFGPPGVFIKGFDHESPMSSWSRNAESVWPGVLDQVPSAFASCVKEPAFSMDDTTFCVWRRVDDVKWRKGNIDYPNGEDPDGSAWMLALLDGNPETYQAYAKGYFEREISLAPIRKIYDATPITSELVREINPDIEFADLLKDASVIAYPIG